MEMCTKNPEIRKNPEKSQVCFFCSFLFWGILIVPVKKYKKIILKYRLTLCLRSSGGSWLALIFLFFTSIFPRSSSGLGRWGSSLKSDSHMNLVTNFSPRTSWELKTRMGQLVDKGKHSDKEEGVLTHMMINCRLTAIKLSLLHWRIQMKSSSNIYITVEVFSAFKYFHKIVVKKKLGLTAESYQN